MGNYMLVFVLLFAFGPVFGTTFLPIPIKNQIVESHGVVKGEVVSINSEEDDNGRIVTRLFLRADKWIGVVPKENHLEIYYPGGQIGDKVQLVHGSPKFEEGEKVVLLLKESNSNLWVQNLALGKFMIKKYGKVDVLINSVFPNHPKVGQIPLATFYDLVKNIKHKQFKERFKDKYELQTEKYAYKNLGKKGRSVASIAEAKEIEEQFNISWLLALLGIMGGIFTFLRRKKDYR